MCRKCENLEVFLQILHMIENVWLVFFLQYDIQAGDGSTFYSF